MKLAAALLALSCSNGGPGDPAIIAPNVELALQPVASNLSSPVHLASPPNDDRLFIVEQHGRIRVVQNGILLDSAFLNIDDKVTDGGGEQGLLSVAFHPQYATNRHLYVYYVDNSGNLQIERYTAPSATSNAADPATARPIINIPHPTFSNHNGGQLAFGPDGFLYIGTGDGGSGGDPPNNAQNRNVLLGKLLRLDVNPANPLAYTVPPDNPFVNTPNARPELWAYGLRNPWRFSFDRTDDLLYIGDVGQNKREEINAVPRAQAGLNYGWRIMEGTSCYNSVSCNRSNLTLPVHEYDTSGGNCAITGGFAYRGSAIPQIVGVYFYSDYCKGGLRSFRLVNGAATDHREWSAGVGEGVSSFGEDRDRELYVIFHRGTVAKLVRAP